MSNLVKRYVFDGVEYNSEYAVRKALFKAKRVVFSKEPSSGKEEFWGYFGVAYTEKEYVPSAAELAAQEIKELKKQLMAYDYIGVKIATGCATIEEYADEIAECEAIRARINELQEVVENAQ